jgi:hypothetical protein
MISGGTIKEQKEGWERSQKRERDSEDVGERLQPLLRV